MQVRNYDLKNAGLLNLTKYSFNHLVEIGYIDKFKTLDEQIKCLIDDLSSCNANSMLKEKGVAKRLTQPVHPLLQIELNKVCKLGIKQFTFHFLDFLDHCSLVDFFDYAADMKLQGKI